MEKPNSQEVGAESIFPHSSDRNSFLIVGIGASAGGVQALKSFFGNVPADSGAAYVVILHLSPDHNSQLPEILQASAGIPVQRITEKVKVEPNHAYVISPNGSLTMSDGHIIISPIHTFEERRAPIDIFFRTLAESHGERAVAVVLSGTGADGSMGIKRVKENGGAAFVQSPHEAEFSEMPQHSIATALIDEVLEVAEIPAKIVAYQKNRRQVVIPVEPEAGAEEQRQALREIFTLLRVRTGHDFSNYKRPTMLRRIERRLNVRSLTNLAAYVAYLRENEHETQALLKDLLISVTNFFRDKEAFLYLEREVVPKILDGKKPGDQVRVWVAGCATGEEAYSLAMLLTEQSADLLNAPAVQIFATDLDEAAISAAREGIYTLNDAADVTPERLRRFFTEEAGGYRVRHELREKILFANHNLLKDPPFSRLDLATCRNLLIYFNQTAQERVLETIHFALHPGSYLFLGISESIDGAGDLYAAVSPEHHIYQSRPTAPRISYPVPDLMPALRFDQSSPVSRLPQERESRVPPERVSYGELHQQLLEQYAPPSLIINEKFDIVHVSPGAGRYLQIAGEISQNLFTLIRPDLRLAVSTAVYQAVQRQTNVEARNVPLKIDDRPESVNLQVRPVMQQSTDPARGFVLVIFEPTANAPSAGEPVFASSEPVARQLEEELMRSQSQHRRSIEQSEVQAEELKASNEELQAMNEEMRSTTEELETGKEELQSVNEELVTVNQELKIKIEEISQSNNDFRNLINSTSIGTIFLDRSFRVKLFTPAAREIFNLIPADAGRVLSDITHRLAGEDLMPDVERVISNLQPVEREVRITSGDVYLMQMTPYRTADDRISGTILTFVNVTVRKRQEDELRESYERTVEILESINDAFYTVDADFNFTYVNQRAEQLWGYEHKNLVGKHYWTEFPQAVGSESYRMHRRAMEERQPLHYETVSSLIGSWIEVSLYPDKRGGLSCYFRDITERKQAEAALRQSEKHLQTAMNAGRIFSWEMNPATRELEWSENMEGVIGFSLNGNIDKTFQMIHPDDIEPTVSAINEALETSSLYQSEYRLVDPATGETFWFHSQGAVTSETADHQPRFVGITQNITDRRRAEEAVRFQAKLLDTVEQSAIATDLDGKVIYWNHFAEHLYGWAAEEALGQNIVKVTAAETSLEQAAEIMSQLREGKSWTGEFTVKRRDGTTFPAQVIDSPITDSAGNLIGIVGVSVDISGRKKAEEAVRESEERLRLIINSVEDYAIITTDPEGIVNSWNTGAEKTFGYTKQEITGRSLDLIFTAEDLKNGTAAQTRQIALETGHAEHERWYLHRNGTRFYASCLMQPLKGGKVPGFVKIIRDLTERIKAEQIEHDKEMLQKLVGAQEDERKRIARDLHDELGQLLTGLRLKLDAVRGLCAGNDALCDKIDETQLLAKRVDDGIDFLAWELRPAALDDLGLPAALAKYVREWSHYAGVAAELLSSDLSKERLNPEAETNLYRIVQEALNNIHKYAGAKNVEVSLNRRNDDSVVLIIADNGSGFDPEAGHNRSTGIGLIGMQERAALMGGTLEIESAPGAGTTIFVRVPTSLMKEDIFNDE